MKEGQELYEVISGLYERHRGMPAISPAWLATEGMKRIGFTRTLHRVGYVGCHLQMRQIARKYLGKHFDPTEHSGHDDDLFPETLQERYPRKPLAGEEPEYVLLQHLSFEDKIYNVHRMRRGANALLKHADALEAQAIATKNEAA